MKKNMRDGIHKLFIITFLFLSPNVFAEPIEGFEVNLQILDKITSQIKAIDIKVNDTYNYGSLKIEITSKNHFIAGFIFPKVEITFNPLAVIFTNFTCFGL